jgi:hypothetical protein
MVEAGAVAVDVEGGFTAGAAVVVGLATAVAPAVAVGAGWAAGCEAMAVGSTRGL